MIHRTDIQVRFNDTDALGHINNTSYALYAELSRIQFLHDVGAQVTSLILAHLSLDFRKQVKFGEEVFINTWVEKLGSSSVTLAQEVMSEGDVVAQIKSVVVHFDYEAQKAKPIPDEVRAVLTDYLNTKTI